MAKLTTKPQPAAGRESRSKRSIERVAPRTSSTMIAEAKGQDGAKREKAVAPPRKTKSQKRTPNTDTAKALKPPAGLSKATAAKASTGAVRTPKKEASGPRKSKQDTVIALLQQPKGTTIAAMMAATAWQQHSVRGFLAGVVRKRMGLNLVSEKTEQGRVYRIARKSAAGGKNKAA